MRCVILQIVERTVENVLPTPARLPLDEDERTGIAGRDHHQWMKLDT